MRLSRFGAIALMSAAAFGQEAPPLPDPVNVDEARLALMAVRSEARDEALEAVASGDALRTLTAIERYFRVAPRDQTLELIQSEVRPLAVRTALARVDELLAADDPQGAIDLLARVGGVADDAELDRAMERASLAHWLKAGAEAEAAGESGAARRAYLRAATIDPLHEGVIAGMERTGAAVPARRGGGEAQDEGVPPDLNIPIQQNRALERDLELALRRVERLEGEVSALNAQSTFSGRAEPATRELDRRLDDLRREVSRLVSDLSRRFDRLESDVDRLRREVSRIR